MNEMIDETLETTWRTIEQKAEQDGFTDQRVYQRLDLEREIGIRLGIVSPGNARELLIQLAPGDQTDFGPPKWVGMNFEIIMLDVPEKGTRHIRLYLNKPEHGSVFITVCADIVNTLLEVVKPEHRTVQLLACLEKWSRFFQKHGIEGLSQEAQRGLFGELSWLGCIDFSIRAWINVMLFNPGMDAGGVIMISNMVRESSRSKPPYQKNHAG